MQDFPKYLLAMAFYCGLAIFTSVFYLFGGVHPFGLTASRGWNALLYIATNLLWIVPLLLFFVGLNEELRGYRWRAVLILAVGMTLTTFDIVYLWYC